MNERVRKADTRQGDAATGLLSRLINKSFFFSPHRPLPLRSSAPQVIIAGAGGAAHLPGMVAALTALPVIGVPVKSSMLSGVDSLYSIVQMPKGIPVATVAIGTASLNIRIHRHKQRLAEWASTGAYCSAPLPSSPYSALLY